MSAQAQETQTKFVPVVGDKEIVASHDDRLIRFDCNTASQVVYVIALVRKDHIIARVVGPHKAGSVPLKLQLPIKWPERGHTVDSGTFKLYKPKDAPQQEAKAKKKGPKRVPGESKMDKCRAFVKKQIAEGHALTKADYLAAFQASDIGCTKMGANTYYLTLKKEFNLP